MRTKPVTRCRLPRTLPIRYRQDFASIMDGRSRLSREVRNRLQALVGDLGGQDALSHARVEAGGSLNGTTSRRREVSILLQGGGG